MSTDSSSDTESGGFKFYHYTPSFAGAVAFAALFAIVTVRHVQLLVRKRTWFFIPFAVGCTFEAIGYAARAYSSKQTPDWTLMPYIIQSLLILLGPAFFAASIYMTLGRLIVFLDAQKYSPIRTTWLTKVFLLGDILSIFGQGGGGGLLASANSQSAQDLGNTVILAGLGIQVLFFSGFMIVTALFHLRIASRPTTQSIGTSAPWQRLLVVLYLASVLILVRSVFRMIEYGQGHDGALIKKEIYIYVLDALLMIIVAVVFAVCHPSASLIGHKILARGVDDETGPDGIPMVRLTRYSGMA